MEISSKSTENTQLLDLPREILSELLHSSISQKDIFIGKIFLAGLAFANKEIYNFFSQQNFFQKIRETSIYLRRSKEQTKLAQLSSGNYRSEKNKSNSSILKEIDKYCNLNIENKRNFQNHDRLVKLLAESNVLSESVKNNISIVFAEKLNNLKTLINEEVTMLLTNNNIVIEKPEQRKNKEKKRHKESKKLKNQNNPKTLIKRKAITFSKNNNITEKTEPLENKTENSNKKKDDKQSKKPPKGSK